MSSEIATHVERPLRQLISTFADSEWFKAHESDIRFELNHLELHDLDTYIFNLHEKGVKVEGNPNNSNLAYLLGITDVEPAGRIATEGGSFPDIDIDFDLNRRDEVIQHLIDTYGNEYVAGIGTFGLMKAKMIFKDLCRLIDVPIAKVNAISKLIPGDAGEDSGDSRCISEIFNEEPELKKIIESDPQIAHVVECGAHFTGVVRSAGQHACGYVISPIPIDQIVPLSVQNSIPVTQFDGSTVEKFGIIKYDILGLKNLSIIDETIRMIKENHGVEIELDAIDLNDPAPFALIGKGNSLGVFQIEGSPGLRSFAARAKPSTISELSDIVALYRPGPMGMKAHEMYIQAKNGEISSEFAIPQYKHIFENTYGLIIYQEQVMQLAIEMSGFTDIRADTLRKAVGKKDRALLLSLKAEFVEGAAAKGIDRDQVDKLFDSMEEFARYGFNKSHSVAYAMIAYYTAYLKAHYLPEFMASLISFSDDPDKQKEYIEDAKRNGVGILPPDVNQSGRDFKVSSSGQILFGLNCIKGLGDKVVEKILKIRPFSSFADFLIKSYHNKGINKRSIEILICSGAMDSFGYNRSAMLAGIDSFLTQYSNEAKATDDAEVARRFIQTQDQYFSGDGIAEFSLFTIAQYEEELLGVSISGDPFKIIDSFIDVEHRTFNDIRNMKVGGFYMVAYVVAAKKIKTKKSGKEMAFLDLKDSENAMISTVVFPDRYEHVKNDIKQGAYVLAHIAIDMNKKDGTVSYIVNNLEDLSSKIESAASSQEADKAMKSIDVHVMKNPGTSTIQSVLKQIEKYVQEEETGSRLALVLHFGGIGFRVGNFNVSQIDVPMLRSFGTFSNTFVARSA